MAIRTHVAVCTVLCVALAAGAQTFTLQPFGGPGGPLDYIVLSADGSLGVFPHQKFWSFPSTYTALPQGADGSGVSPDGQWALGRDTVGSAAARYSRSGSADVFTNSVTGLVPNTAYASSSGNNVVVGYGLVNGAAQHGFLWRLGDGTADVGVLAGDASSSLVDVSADGNVSAGWGITTGSGSRHPLRYDEQGFSKLSKAGGGFVDGGEANAISADGTVIVGTAQSGSALHGFRWTLNGGSIDLLSAADANDESLETMAFDVSSNGAWVVGQSQDSSPTGSTIATVWDSAGVPHRLADLLGDEPTHGLYELRTASSVSSDGLTVSGICFDASSGQFRGYIATIVPGGGGGSCEADLGGAGGESGSDGALDNNDFIVFIGDFFEMDPAADFGSAGGVAGADGAFDNNDFIAFINAFFAGCNP